MMKRALVAAAVTAVLGVAEVHAAVIASPGAVTVVQGQQSSVVTLTFTYGITPPGDTRTVQFGGLPSGVTTVPSPVTYQAVLASNNTTLQFAASDTAPPGVYTITISDPAPGAGSTTLVLTVAAAPSFSASVSPQPVVLTMGGGAAPVTVQTIPEPGFAASSITYYFSGLPNWVQTGGSGTTTGPSWPPVTFGFSLAAGATPGTYVGQLIGNPSSGAGRTYPVTVVVSAPPPPVIASIAPGSIQAGASGVTFTLTGSGFQPGATVASSSSDFTVSGVAVVSATQVRFSGSAAPTAAPGPRTVTVTNPDGQSSAPATVQVTLSAPPVIASIAPGSIQAGASGVTFTLTGSGFQPGATVASSSSDFTVSGVAVVSATQVRFSGSAPLTAPPGPRTVTVTNPDGQTSKPAMVRVTPAPRPVITLVTPFSIRAGDRNVEVAVQGSGFQPGATAAYGTTDVLVGAVTVASATRITFPITVLDTASPGSRPLRVTNPDGQRSAPFATQVLPPPPLVHAVEPPAMVAGTLTMTVYVRGERFAPGARVVASSPSIVVESAMVERPDLIRTVVSAPRGAAPGPVRLEVSNPDGGRSVPGGVLLVYPVTSLGAPATVTAAAIVFPEDGAFLTPGQDVFARAVLATGGTGQVIGSWRLDGVPFERFVAAVQGGEPVQISTRAPVPDSFLGAASLDLVVESPQLHTAPAIRLIRTEQRSSGLRLIRPEDGAVIGPTPPDLRWSLVPGAFGYEVELRGPHGNRTIRTSEPALRLDLRVVDELGPGSWSWSVRPVLGGGVLGTPTPEWTLTVLPKTVDLTVKEPRADAASGRPEISWSGGARGFVYRLEMSGSDRPLPMHAALTGEAVYTMPRGAAGARLDVQVLALGPDGSVHGRSPVVGLRLPDVEPQERTTGAVLSAAPTELISLAPGDGATVNGPGVAVAARWTGPVDPADVRLVLDGVDVTPLTTLAPDGAELRAPFPLAAGVHAVVLTLPGGVSRWTFTVAGDEEGEEVEEPEEPPPPPPGLDSNWELSAGLDGNFSHEGGNDTLRLLTSAQWDVVAPRVETRAAGDVSMRHDLGAPHATVQESRNWLVEAGTAPGTASGRVIVGYAAPRFVEGAQLLTTGYARGGAEGTVATRFGTASYYRTLKAIQAGVMGGFGADQQVEAWAVETPAMSSGLVLRMIGVRTETVANLYSRGETGTITGLYGVVPISPALRINFEGARGELTPSMPEDPEPERKGNAYLLGLAGDSGTFGYALNLRYTQARFVNPANPGFTPATNADRAGAELQLRKSFGSSSMAVQLRHLRGGETSGASGPSARENTANVTFTTSVVPHLNLTLSGDLGRVTGDADEETSLPATDVRTQGLSATFSESFGSAYLSQTISWIERRDEVTPALDQSTSTVSMSAGGPLTAAIGLNGNASWTRMETGSPAVSTEMRQLSLQPTWTVPRTGLTLQPRAAYSRSEGGYGGGASTTEQAQMVVSWAPPFLGSAATLQLSGDWSRTRIEGMPAPPFRRTLLASFNLHWGASSTATDAVEPVALTPRPGPDPLLLAAMGHPAGGQGRW